MSYPCSRLLTLWSDDGLPKLMVPVPEDEELDSLWHNVCDDAHQPNCSFLFCQPLLSVLGGPYTNREYEYGVSPCHNSSTNISFAFTDLHLRCLHRERLQETRLLESCKPEWFNEQVVPFFCPSVISSMQSVCYSGRWESRLQTAGAHNMYAPTIAQLTTTGAP